jgi:hypothetical protein
LDCAGCYHFDAAHATVKDYPAPGQRVYFAAASGEVCDVEEFGCREEENHWFGAELKNTVLTACPQLIISRYAHRVPHTTFSRKHKLHIIKPIDPAFIDAAELYDLGMMSDRHYKKFISAHRGSRIEVAGQFARLMTHARAWKACIESGNGLPCLIAEHSDILNVRAIANGAWVQTDDSTKLILSDKSLLIFTGQGQFPSQNWEIAENAAPPYLLAPRAARLLFQNLWSIFWDADAQDLVSVGPAVRDKGLVVFIHAVCRAQSLACRTLNMHLSKNDYGLGQRTFSHKEFLLGLSTTNAKTKANIKPIPYAHMSLGRANDRGSMRLRNEEIMLNLYCSSLTCGVSSSRVAGSLGKSALNNAPLGPAIPRKLYTLAKLVDKVKARFETLDLAENWSIIPLVDVRGSSGGSSEPSKLSSCVQEIFRKGGVCLLSSSVVLPDNIDDILDGLDTFVVHSPIGYGISPGILGTAPMTLSRSRLPQYPISAEYNDENYVEDLAALSREVSPAITVFAQSVFYPEHFDPLSSASFFSARNFVKNSKGSVPKIFHFIHLGPNDISPLVKRTVSSWLRFHPNWQAMLWRDADLTRISRLLPLIRTATKWAQKADILRMEVLYEYGGVYVDTDFEAFGRLDSWVESVPGAICNEFPISDLDTQRSISNGFFAIARRHHLVRRALMHLQWRSRLNTKWINQETGPFFFRNVLGDDVRSLRMIPSHILFPVSFGERKKLQSWKCYEKGPCTSAMLRLNRDVVAAHLWNRDGAGWSVNLGESHSANPIIESLAKTISLHNSIISLKK